MYLVVTDEAYAAAHAAGRIASVSQDGVTYPGGYVDIKLACPRCLTTAVVRADDPTRASFAHARVSLDKTGKIPDWIVGWLGPPEQFELQLSRFIIDNELAWLNDTIPPEFW